ncbi:hypothetical protein BC938DRAFT_478378 [Jimgerdemannia flammicorona]|uniref:Fungal-type protein kinase domain-containing protein n=1 Tax=Jimgerdemannia flammicorona TaxID=994334 RepID=A0A433QMY7_9FUNG|nr:hypothetical protein BC938DRAFT_478378 [Jimgerdemannia flammicorona]
MTIFVHVIFGFCMMDLGTLGYDPTIKIAKENVNTVFSHIDITCNKMKETFILIRPIFIHLVVSSHGIICWEAYKKGNSKTLYAIKDIWQYVKASIEDMYITEYYHHEKVHICGKLDDIKDNFAARVGKLHPCTYDYVNIWQVDLQLRESIRAGSSIA